MATSALHAVNAIASNAQAASFSDAVSGMICENTGRIQAGGMLPNRRMASLACVTRNRSSVTLLRPARPATPFRPRRPLAQRPRRPYIALVCPLQSAGRAVAINEGFPPAPTSARPKHPGMGWHPLNKIGKPSRVPGSAVASEAASYFDRINQRNSADFPPVSD